MNDKLRPILIVEDLAADLDLTKRALARRRLPNPVQEARNGEEALAYMARWEAGEPTPVFILLDLKLPKVSGLEVLRRLKEHPRFSTIPVIVLSIVADERDVEEAYRLGCNSYIVKPNSFDKYMEVTAQLEFYWCALNTAPR